MTWSTNSGIESMTLPICRASLCAGMTVAMVCPLYIARAFLNLNRFGRLRAEASRFPAHEHKLIVFEQTAKDSRKRERKLPDRNEADSYYDASQRFKVHELNMRLVRGISVFLGSDKNHSPVRLQHPKIRLQ